MIRECTGLLTALCLVGCTPTVYGLAGVPNYHIVGPGVRRGGQPTTVEQWRAIAADLDADTGPGHTHYRVKLNFFDESPADDGGSVAAGFVVLYFPMQPADDRSVFQNLADTLVVPSAARDAAVFHAIVDHVADGVYFGCTHGQDRTGYESARLRVKFYGWTPAQAYSEWQSIGFDPELFGLQRGWTLFAEGGAL